MKIISLNFIKKSNRVLFARQIHCKLISHTDKNMFTLHDCLIYKKIKAILKFIIWSSFLYNTPENEFQFFYFLHFKKSCLTNMFWFLFKSTQQIASPPINFYKSNFFFLIFVIWKKKKNYFWSQYLLQNFTDFSSASCILIHR